MNTNLKLVTYNIRYSWDGDGTNSMFCRLGLILEKISKENPDIICFQEATVKNMSVLSKCLAPEYTVLLNQREVGLTGEGLAVAYKKERVSLYGLEIFWLSETPHVVATRFEGQYDHSRICQRLLFKDESTGKIFRIYNLHLDFLNEELRYLQMKVVMERAMEDKKQNDWPFFIVGDFNAQSDEKGMKYTLVDNDLGVVDLTSEIPGSFHGYGTVYPTVKIDYIIADKDTAQKPHSVETWTDCVNGVYLSDHYPVALNIEM